MNGLHINIENETQKNTAYRKVIYTGRYSQLVFMSLLPGIEIGNEVHGGDQFIRIESGNGIAILNNDKKEIALRDGDALIVPAGTWHNIINTGKIALKLYTLYSLPQHKDKVIEKTKADEKEEPFDGITTE